MIEAPIRDPTDGGDAYGQVADVGPRGATGWQDGFDEPAKLRRFADKLK